jgi:hypothetical protein
MHTKVDFSRQNFLFCILTIARNPLSAKNFYIKSTSFIFAIEALKSAADKGVISVAQHDALAGELAARIHPQLFCIFVSSFVFSFSFASKL